MKRYAKTRKALCALLAGTVLWSGMGAASAAEKDIDAQIADQQQILKELNEKKAAQSTKEIQRQLAGLEEQLKDLKKKPSYDAKGAIDAIAA